jgi:hypothetical protein
VDIFGEFEEEEAVTNDWYFRPLNRADNIAAQTDASSRHPHQREVRRPIDDAIRFGLACGGKHAVQAVKERPTSGQPHYIESRFDPATGQEKSSLWMSFPGNQELPRNAFNECGVASILAGFGIPGPFTHLGESIPQRSLTVNYNREEEIEERNEVGQSINEIALHAMDNAAMLIKELAALGAFKLHDSVDTVRVSAVHTQLRNEISEIIACTQSLAALREQLLGVNVKAEFAA